MRIGLLVNLALAMLFLTMTCGTTEESFLRRHKIESATVAGLNLSIYLPPDYSNANAYPVIYFNDGQTLFGETTSSWALQKTLDRLIQKKQIAPVIVVGIHSDANRTSDYVPYEDQWVRHDFGAYTPRARQYTEKLIQKIIPYIDSTYTTDTKRRAIMGASFGGLQATWAALNDPEHFSMAAGFSPSYWVKDYQIFEEGNQAKPHQQFYFDMGTAEWNYYVPMIPALNLEYGKQVFYYEVPGGRHTDADWATRVHNALLIFAGTQQDQTYSWDVEIEVIKSQSQANKFYLRMNPIIRFKNGLTYSLSLAAKYELVNKEDGEVKEDGRFEFKNPKNLEVVVSYKGESKKVTLNYKTIEQLKKG
ncbi:MAG: alpha/beta hydrolase-fold protein [Saprospiraceae bacterium]|nr:alpha/beta hydrolase-fold protein [Saprospiraceae bacterium]